jgi:hypothetical protein
MITKKFDSPREEALEIAITTRNKILDEKLNTVAILRSCLVIAESLGKKQESHWIKRELHGYSIGDEDFPSYRFLLGQPLRRPDPDNIERVKIIQTVHEINGCEKQERLPILDFRGEEYYFTKVDLQCLMEGITDRCLEFINNMITELQYGSIVEYIMEEIRKSTDEKIALLDNQLFDEAKSMVENLSTANPADWNKVGHSSRKMLAQLADKVFPPKEGTYTLKNGKSLKVDASTYVNRLVTFLDQKTSGEEGNYKIAEVEYLEFYLSKIAKEAQAVEHSPSIDKYRANMLAVHTYLIISEIMRYMT